MIALGGSLLGLAGAGVIVFLAVIGGVHLLSKLERFYLTRRAIHERLGPSLTGDDVSGDVPNLPEGFSFHSRKD